MLVSSSLATCAGRSMNIKRGGGRAGGSVAAHKSCSFEAACSIGRGGRGGAKGDSCVARSVRRFSAVRDLGLRRELGSILEVFVFRLGARGRGLPLACLAQLQLELSLPRHRGVESIDQWRPPYYSRSSFCGGKRRNGGGRVDVIIGACTAVDRNRVEKFE